MKNIHLNSIIKLFKPLKWQDKKMMNNIINMINTSRSFSLKTSPPKTLQTADKPISIENKYFIKNQEVQNRQAIHDIPLGLKDILDKYQLLRELNTEHLDLIFGLQKFNKSFIVKYYMCN